MKIVIISPTYNEKANMEKMIPVLEEEIFPTIKNHDMQILIADDKSPDGTAEVIKEYQKKYKNLHLIMGEKQGLGAAYVRGMKYAMDELNADAVMEFDADFQHDPHDIPRLIVAMDAGADYVIGSRYVPGGAIPKEWGIDRKFLSVFGSLFIRVAWLNFKIHDMTSGFKLTKTSYLKKIDLDHLLSKNFSYKIQILHEVIKQGAKVKEVPIVFHERTQGGSKISQNDQFESLYIVLRLALDDHKRIIKFLFVGGTGFIFQYMTVSYLVVHGDADQSIAAMIGGEVAILSNFFLNNIWTFKDTEKIKQKGSLFMRLLKFNTASLLSIGLQSLATFIAVAILGENVQIFGRTIHTVLVTLFPTIIFLVIPLNYFIYNKLIWKTQYLKKSKPAEILTK